MAFSFAFLDLMISSAVCVDISSSEEESPSFRPVTGFSTSSSSQSSEPWIQTHDQDEQRHWHFPSDLRRERHGKLAQSLKDTPLRWNDQVRRVPLSWIDSTQRGSPHHQHVYLIDDDDDGGDLDDGEVGSKEDGASSSPSPPPSPPPTSRKKGRPRRSEKQFHSEFEPLNFALEQENQRHPIPIPTRESKKNNAIQVLKGSKYGYAKIQNLLAAWKAEGISLNMTPFELVERVYGMTLPPGLSRVAIGTLTKEIIRREKDEAYMKQYELYLKILQGKVRQRLCRWKRRNMYQNLNYELLRSRSLQLTLEREREEERKRRELREQSAESREAAAASRLHQPQSESDENEQ